MFVLTPEILRSRMAACERLVGHYRADWRKARSSHRRGVAPFYRSSVRTVIAALRSDRALLASMVG